MIEANAPLTLEVYFGPRWGSPECTDAMKANAMQLITRVNALLMQAGQSGAFQVLDCPNTGTCISGAAQQPPSGDGGFRGRNSTTGVPGSEHRRARAVDIYDPDNQLDAWISRFDLRGGVNTLLERYALWREHPLATPGWCHLQSAPPRSGRRTFWP